MDMPNICKQGVKKTLKLLNLTFGFLRPKQKLFIYPVLPWVVDNESFPLAKELFNSMWHNRCMKGIRLDNDIKIRRWRETKTSMRTLMTDSVTKKLLIGECQNC